MVIRKKNSANFVRPPNSTPGLRLCSLYNVYGPSGREKPLFLIKKSLMTPSFSSVCRLSHVSNNTTSLNIGGTDTWAVPPPLILGGRTPVPPKAPPIKISQHLPFALIIAIGSFSLDQFSNLTLIINSQYNFALAKVTGYRIVIVISKLLKRYLKAKRTKALQLIHERCDESKGVFQRGSQEKLRFQNTRRG